MSPWSQGGALQQDVHLILLCFIWISLSTPEIFFLLDDRVRYCGLFFLENNQVYTSNTRVYISIHISIEQLPSGFYIFDKLGDAPTIFKITLKETVFFEMVPSFTVIEGIF